MKPSLPGCSEECFGDPSAAVEQRLFGSETLRGEVNYDEGDRGERLRPFGMRV